jgi:hypothetical protein
MLTTMMMMMTRSTTPCAEGRKHPRADLVRGCISSSPVNDVAVHEGLSNPAGRRPGFVYETTLARRLIMLGTPT